MMKEKWIEMFHNANDHRTRAEILLTMPVFTAMKYHDELERACARAGFDPGRQYLVGLHVALSGRRFRGGFAENSQALVVAESQLLLILDGRTPGDGG